MFENNRDDETYFARRACEERTIALTCEDTAAARAHLTLADLYEGQLAGSVIRLPVAG